MARIPEFVLGHGIDLVECARIGESLQRFGERFERRVFLPDEVAYCRSQKFPERHFAARFAAKEAVSKAFGTGIGSVVGWLDLEVTRDPSGRPQLCLHGGAAAWLDERGGGRVELSLTHTDHYAAASAVLIGYEGS